MWIERKKTDDGKFAYFIDIIIDFATFLLWPVDTVMWTVHKLE